MDPLIRFKLLYTLGTEVPCKEAILQRLSENFKGFFSDQRTVQKSSLAKILQVDVKLELDDPTTRQKIKKAESGQVTRH